MAASRERTGRCVCGSVTFRAPEASDRVGACHCGTCRRWSGGPWMTIECGSTVEIDGGEHVSRYDSSDWAERGFCARCGSHLFYRLKQQDVYIMSAGLFDETDGLVFDHQVFVDEQPAYYAFANETRRQTGPELFAAFGAQPD